MYVEQTSIRFSHVSDEYCDGIARWRADPFMAEIHDTPEYDWFCECRYQLLCDEI